MFKKQVPGKGKRAVSTVYDNAAQSQNEDNDYGDLPRSKEELIDLSRSLLPMMKLVIYWLLMKN